MLFILLLLLGKRKKKKSIIIVIIAFIFVSLLGNITSENVASKNISTFFNDISKVVTKDKESNEFKKTGSGRMRLWMQGLQFISEKPILGYGPENLGDKYLKCGITMDRPHNLLIQLATNSGLPGLLLYMSAIRNNLIQKL